MRRDIGICVPWKEEGGAGDILEWLEDAINDEIIVAVVVAVVKDKMKVERKVADSSWDSFSSSWWPIT